MTIKKAREIVAVGVMPGEIDSLDLAHAKGFLEGWNEALEQAAKLVERSDEITHLKTGKISLQPKSSAGGFIEGYSARDEQVRELIKVGNEINERLKAYGDEDLRDPCQAWDKSLAVFQEKDKPEKK